MLTTTDSQLNASKCLLALPFIIKLVSQSSKCTKVHKHLHLEVCFHLVKVCLTAHEFNFSFVKKKKKKMFYFFFQNLHRLTLTDQILLLKSLDVLQCKDAFWWTNYVTATLFLHELVYFSSSGRQV